MVYSWVGLAVISVIAAFFAWKARAEIKRLLGLDAKSAAAAALIFILTLGTQLVLPSYHRMYIDEPWYLESAKNILTRGDALICTYTGIEKRDCEPYLKMHGWPFVLAASFALFGSTDATAFATSAFFSAFAPAVLFLLARLLFRRDDAAFFASIFLALDPTRLYWSGSAETNAPVLVFALLALLAGALVFKSKPGGEAGDLLALSAALFVLASSMRAEYAFLAVPLFFLTRKNFSEKSLLAVTIIALIGIASVMPQLAGNSKSQKSTYPNDFGVQNIDANIQVLLSKAVEFPAYIALALLALCGFFLLFKREKQVFLALSFAATIFLEYVLLWSEFSKPFQDRMLLPSIALLSLAAGIAASELGVLLKARLSAAIIAVVLFAALLSQFPGVQMRASYYNLENEAVTGLRNFPPDCYVVAERPSVVHASTSLKAVSTRFAISSPETIGRIRAAQGCVLYLEDVFCSSADFANPNTLSNCRKMHEFFALEKIIAFESRGEVMAIYRVA